MTSMKKLIAVAGTLVLVVGASVAIGAGGPGERFAQGQDRGENPLAKAAGTIEKPRVLYAKIKTFPRGARVGAKYRTECVKGARAGTRGDEFAGDAPILKKLRMRYDDPDVCAAEIVTRMAGRGTLKVVLRADK